ncbi:hypothetical protein [Streptomyces sp. Ru72]|uniref:hypothetical protein n=1 Tax=Streptomyces sp. Ru72 TaxID=2080747 RepID=UPI000CDD515B|nr:hypothetical protein [Streptomyces sp. Ru72]POX44925.1 hypothetical protein C3488_31190 [Streptomyces sp. Ru72]
MFNLQLGCDSNNAAAFGVNPPIPATNLATASIASKDPVETELHTAVCSGKVTLAAAQQAIATDWITALAKLELN